MSSMTSGECGHLLGLPVELIQKIGYYLPTDEDLGNLIKASRQLAETLSPPNSGVWRGLFFDKWDPVSQPSNGLKKEYQFRSIIFRKPVSFAQGESGREFWWLRGVTTLINESFSCFKEDELRAGRPSLNVQAIGQMLEESDFLDRPVVGYNLQEAVRPSASFLGVQLCFTYMALRLERPFRSLRQDYDIAIAYGFPGPAGFSIFKGENVDLEQVLHIRNFWKRHLTSQEEYSFQASFKSVDLEDRPKPWNAAVGSRFNIFANWMGYHSCIHPYQGIDDLLERQTCADYATHWSYVPRESIRLDGYSNGAETWPLLFSHAFPYSQSVLPNNRVWFYGYKSNDKEINDEYDVFGFTERLPQTQGGILGWQRICFIVFEMTDDTSDEYVNWPTGQKWEPRDWDDFTWAIGYEGTILPGGRIMLGRWKNLKAAEGWDSGPFIFWQYGQESVDDSEVSL